MFAETDQQREKECRLRRHYEQKLKTNKDIVEQLDQSSRAPSPDGESELRQEETPLGNLEELEKVKQCLEKEIKSNQEMKFKLRSQEEIIQDLEWKVAEITVQLNMATASNGCQIPDQVSEPGCPSVEAESKPELFSTPSVDSDSEVPEPQAESKPQVVSGELALQPQDVSRPEEDLTSDVERKTPFVGCNTTDVKANFCLNPAHARPCQ
ncbi:uncharacterized protein LOC121649331 [Melanotaenia boesemani]|uniref:uncharacterized protein LOC121649331 n=1 Tax=Melanotaenia boesemani TaxID=1250792 RepID=UPI001C048F74|nr:uncharacterized protein LOC121649331 [Melanotaenia boesemani]